jgi:hypothetical protein
MGIALASLEAMWLFPIVVYLAIGAASGAIVRALIPASRGWVLVWAVLGFVGALLGAATGRLTQLASLFGVDLAGHSVAIGWAMSGAIFLVIWGIAGQVLLAEPRTATARQSTAN